MRKMSVHSIRIVLQMLETKKRPDRAVIKPHPQYPPGHIGHINYQPPRYPMGQK